MYKFYGDSRVVTQHYPNLVSFMDNLLSHANTSSVGGLVSSVACQCVARKFVE